MNKLDNLLAEIRRQSPTGSGGFVELDHTADELFAIPEVLPMSCHVPQIGHFFKWKRAFSYLFTGTPGTGKTTMLNYMLCLMAFRENTRAIIWTQEMEDAHLADGKVKYNVKDVVNLLAWTAFGKHPGQMDKAEARNAYGWVMDHFAFFHAHDRTPAGIADAFKSLYDKRKADFLIIDPWKSVNQEITGRSDTWLENVLMSFKELSLETNTVFGYVVHPKSLKDYREADGQYRIITPFDLNGGAAWSNSMDMITSLRRISADYGDVMEWHQQKIRKQHIMGVPEIFYNITLDKRTNRYLFNGSDPFNLTDLEKFTETNTEVPF
jgi:hypothetical protein